LKKFNEINENKRIENECKKFEVLEIENELMKIELKKENELLKSKLENERKIK